MTDITILIDEAIKIKAEKASVLLDMPSIEAYITMLIDEDASRVIAEHQTMTIDDKAFDSFLVSCDKDAVPNSELLSALELTKE